MHTTTTTTKYKKQEKKKLKEKGKVIERKWTTFCLLLFVQKKSTCSYIHEKRRSNRKTR